MKYALMITLSISIALILISCQINDTCQDDAILTSGEMAINWTNELGIYFDEEEAWELIYSALQPSMEEINSSVHIRSRSIIRYLIKGGVNGVTQVRVIGYDSLGFPNRIEILSTEGYWYLVRMESFLTFSEGERGHRFTVLFIKNMETDEYVYYIW